MLEKYAPIRRQHESTSLAIEEWDFQFFLQLSNSAANGRLRNEELFGSACHMFPLGHLPKVP
jgi:hypothetical protein